MPDPWRFAVVALLLASLALGGCLFGYGVRTFPVEWTVAFGNSRVLSSEGLLAFNVGMAILYFILTVLYTIDWWQNEDRQNAFAYYLTNWSLYVELVYLCVLPFTTSGAMRARPPESPGQQPKLASLTVVLFHLAMPACVLVVGLFWTLETPVWKLCLFNDVPECKPVPKFFNHFAHLYNLLLLLLSLWVNFIPWHFRNSGWILIYTTAYIAWTVLHFLFGLGPALYDAFSWETPDKTLVTAAAVQFLVTPAVIVICWGAAWARDHCAGRKDVDEGRGYVQPMEWSGP